MEPVLTLKREHATDFDVCIICQCSTNQEVKPATEYGIRRLQEVCSERLKFKDVKNLEIITRLLTVFNSTTMQNIVLLRQCYNHFTDSSNISRLEKACEKSTGSKSCVFVININDPTCEASCTSRRSMLPAIDYKLCLFCQKSESIDKVHSVETFGLSNKNCV